MTEQMTLTMLSVLGVILLPLALVVLTVKGVGDKVVTWRGFGVVFEIKPCANCRIRRASDNKRPHDEL